MNDRLKLTIWQRTKILEILPSIGTREQGIIQRDIVKKLEITQEDVKRCNIRTETIVTKDGVTPVTAWENDTPQEFDLTELEIHRLKTLVDGLNKSSQLPLDGRFIDVLEQLDSIKYDDLKGASKQV